MEDHPMLLFFCIALFLLLSDSDSAAVDTISVNEAIKDGDTIVSDGEMFELGFFSPRNSKNRYLGIWYKKISNGTVVWVANRERPINDTSGMFKVGSRGSLLILSGSGRNTVIWSSNSTVSVRNLNPVAQLLDTGNLVVWDKSSINRNLIWQSFDYPGNTMLPGMKFGKDLLTGIDRSLTSWKSPDDPSPGLYSYLVDTNGYPQIFQRQGSVLHFRIGPWNGIKFRGLPMDKPNGLYSYEFVVNQKEIYYKYELKGSVVQRILLMSDGKTVQLHWIEKIQDWVVYGNPEIDTCASYGRCGPYGSCSINIYPPCRCMEGFVPTLQEEWNATDWSSGCKLKEPLNCRSGDGFKRLSGLKFPDTQRSWYNRSMTLGECEMACKRNCSCTAYANLDVRNGGSGCLLWFYELMDIREHDEDQVLYIRMAASELAGFSQSTANKKKGVLTVVLSILSVVLLLSAVVYACRNKKKIPHMRKRGNRAHASGKKNSSVHTEYLDELPFLSLNKIVKATNNFSINNKIGEGGFGPVYKGVLEDGRVIAVKRHSETSQQGLDEFKNEIICIAKLQHRNLVKLIGYCIHGNEKILIYEYMANKSLDSFLFGLTLPVISLQILYFVVPDFHTSCSNAVEFLAKFTHRSARCTILNFVEYFTLADETRSSMLDWAQRFSIIHGMARGILYLHQDSCIQIIHRDLKAGNILLDDDMNPKISDFGLARKFEGYDSSAKTKKVVGTYGYISPEYAVHGRFSTKSDVFSFGVLVLEIVSGKKNRGFSHEDHSDNLLGHAWRLYKEDKSIKLMSASLRDSCVVSEVLRAIHVGLLCVQHYVEDRPAMLSVVLMLVSEGSLPQPKQPAFFSGERQGLESVSSLNEYTITLLHAR